MNTTKRELNLLQSRQVKHTPQDSIDELIITRDDVVSQRLKFGSTFLRSQKLPRFFNFPVSRTRPEKIV